MDITGFVARTWQGSQVDVLDDSQNSYSIRGGRGPNEVAAWLTRLNLGEYAEEFRSQGIDLALLKTLNMRDLAEELGVKKLGDRRKIMDGIHYVVSHDFTSKSLPEDGRILTHLFNIRIFLAWVRCCIRLAIALIFLLPCDARTYIRGTTIAICVSTFVLLLTAGWRYFVMYNIAEKFSEEILLPADITYIPVLLGSFATFVTAALLSFAQFAPDGTCPID